MSSKPPPTASQYLWFAHALLLLTVYGSLIPLRFEPRSWKEAVEQFTQIRVFDPRLVGARGDWAVNMVQYAALSFCYMAALGVDRRREIGLFAAAAVVPAGIAVAAVLEFVQVYFPPRTVSLNDILVESAGVILGAAAWLLAGPRVTDWLRRFLSQKGLAGLAVQLLPAYLFLLLVVHLVPFDFVFGRTELAEKYREGRIHLVPFTTLAGGGVTGLAKLATNVAVFFLLGVLLGLIPNGSRWGWPTVLQAGLAVTTIIELLQLVVFTPFCDATDVVTGTAAVLLGWWLARVLAGPPAGLSPRQRRLRAAWTELYLRVRRWSPRAWVIAALGWAALLVLVNWYPYDFTTDPARFQDSDAELSDEHTAVQGLRRLSWAPFVDYYWGSRKEALEQFGRRTLSFAPLGILLGVAFRQQRRDEAAVVLTALLLATLIEGGQYFIPQRHPSVTDLLIEVLGAWLGYKAFRHAAGALQPACTPRLTV
jgi:glycopeptide antibiotics resistance protein